MLSKFVYRLLIVIIFCKIIDGVSFNLRFCLPHSRIITFLFCCLLILFFFLCQLSAILLRHFLIRLRQNALRFFRLPVCLIQLRQLQVWFLLFRIDGDGLQVLFLCFFIIHCLQILIGIGHVLLVCLPGTYIFHRKIAGQDNGGGKDCCRACPQPDFFYFLLFLCLLLRRL